LIGGLGLSIMGATRRAKESPNLFRLASCLGSSGTGDRSLRARERSTLDQAARMIGTEASMWQLRSVALHLDAQRAAGMLAEDNGRLAFPRSGTGELQSMGSATSVELGSARFRQGRAQHSGPAAQRQGVAPER
jgi:hypothetical protein